MKLLTKQQLKALKAERQNETTTSTQQARTRLIRLLIEMSPGYGYRTIKKLIKYVRGAKVKDLPIRTTPTKQQAMGFKGHAIRELNEYAAERETDLATALADVPTEDIRWVLDNLASSRLELRYASRQPFKFTPEKLKAEREIKIRFRKTTVGRWLKESKASVEERKAARKAQKKADRALARKVSATPKRRLTTNVYLKQIQALNDALTPRYEDVTIN